MYMIVYVGVYVYVYVYVYVGGFPSHAIWQLWLKGSVNVNVKQASCRLSEAIAIYRAPPNGIQYRWKYRRRRRS